MIPIVYPSFRHSADVSTCSTTTNTEQRWWQVKMDTVVVESVAVVLHPGSFQHFSIFVIELMEGNKAMYKPCSAFEGEILESTIIFLCNGGEGHRGKFLYIRDEREDDDHFSLCEVQVFPLLGMKLMLNYQKENNQKMQMQKTVECLRSQ